MKKYYIEVEEIKKDSNNSETTSNNYNTESAKKCLDIISKEYDHITERGNKLDNKVSIILAFTGVIFVVIAGLLELNKSLTFPVDEVLFKSLTPYISISIIDMTLYTISICTYLYILLPRTMRRLNADSIITQKLYKDELDVISKYVSVQYCNSINENHKILEKNYSKLKFGLCIEIIAIILSVILLICKSIIFI